MAKIRASPYDNINLLSQLSVCGTRLKRIYGNLKAQAGKEEEMCVFREISSGRERERLRKDDK